MFEGLVKLAENIRPVICEGKGRDIICDGSSSPAPPLLKGGVCPTRIFGFATSGRRILIWCGGLTILIYLFLLISIDVSYLPKEENLIFMPPLCPNSSSFLVRKSKNLENSTSIVNENEVDFFKTQNLFPLCQIEPFSVCLPQKDVFPTCSGFDPVGTSNSNKNKSVKNRPENGQKCILRDDYVLIANYMGGLRSYECDESITYATHGDFRFLDNLINLMDFWPGPISIALYCPADDLLATLYRIYFLIKCYPHLDFLERVNFHIFFEKKFIKSALLLLQNVSFIEEQFGINGENCDLNQQSFGSDLPNYRLTNELLYPVNVARNLARQNSPTNFVLLSDIELYPMPGNLIERFLLMLKKYPTITRRRFPPRVFVLPVFEVNETVELPQEKAELVEMLRNGSAISFHKHVCRVCHEIPRFEKWMEVKNSRNYSKLFNTVKRRGPNNPAEFIFIGTKMDPLYDERLSWEGQRDKMTQAYLMCLLNYDFMILDDAFLVHKQGIKMSVTNSTNLHRTHQNFLIENVIKKDLNSNFGTKKRCYI